MNRVSLIILMAAFAAIIVGCNPSKLTQAYEEYARGEYFEAHKHFREAYNRVNAVKERNLKGELAFYMGESLMRLNDAARASVAFSNAIRYGYPDSTLIFNYAKSLQASGKYAEAMKQYESFIASGATGTKAELAKEGIEGCTKATERGNSNDSKYIVKPVSILMSNRSEFSPFVGGEGNDILYFTATYDNTLGDKTSSVTGMKNSDIFISKKDENGNWQKATRLEGEINTEADEGIISLTPDGMTMYLTRVTAHPSSDSRIEIFRAKRSDAFWNEPELVQIDVDSISTMGHPSVSPDGKWLYFCSDIPGGYGGLDIWKVSLSGEKNRPVNLGPQINTPGDESFPCLRNDSILYFSSDGHPGFGGLDIFKASLNSTGDFWTIENFGPPVNSAGDDFGITFGEGESGFFSSNRNDSRGRDHIYSFIKPDIRIGISGTVTDMDDEPVANAIIRIVGNDGSNRRQRSGEDGMFRFELDRGVDYVMKAGAEGYLNANKAFTSSPEEENAEYEIDFKLAAINKPQVVENIFFDFDKASLRDESKEALDEMARIMKENPNVTIEMGAHTDRKGSDAYNMNLSQRRAQSVVDYLVKSGINPQRLHPKGYGKTRPKAVTKRINRDYPQFPIGTVLSEEYIETLSEENREAADQINRRTEFSVLSTDFDDDMLK